MKRIRIIHNTTYSYSEEVELLPHKLMIRPREGHDIYIENSILQITPENKIKWQRDIYGNSVAIVSFAEPTRKLRIESDVIVRHFEEQPLDFLVDDKALHFPFFFDPSERVDLIPYQTLCFPSDSDELRVWLQQFWQPGQSIETFVLLNSINNFIVANFSYNMREEAGVQRPRETLALGSGSCRDFATLFIEACRYFGLAARFVSGYLHEPQYRRRPWLHACLGRGVSCRAPAGLDLITPVALSWDNSISRPPLPAILRMPRPYRAVSPARIIDARE